LALLLPAEPEVIESINILLLEGRWLSNCCLRDAVTMYELVWVE
jgi:hypothetical protein